VRLSEIVNTVQAYRNLQQALAGRTLEVAKKNSSAADNLIAQSLGFGDTSSADQTDPSQQDSLSLSGATPDASQSADPADDSLGAIVEQFLSQRQTYSFTIPGVGGMTSPISVTWEVQKAYHVIQFVPQSQVGQLGQSVDQVA
jgi:hypothetical protein